MTRVAFGSGDLSLLVLALAGLSVYRPLVVRWDAWHGNLRFAALAFLVLNQV